MDFLVDSEISSQSKEFTLNFPPEIQKIFRNESQQCIGLIRRTTKMTRPLPFSNEQRAWSGLPSREEITHDCGENVSTPLRHDEFPKVRASMNSGDEGGSLFFSWWSIGMYSLHSCLVWFTSLPLLFYIVVSSFLTDVFQEKHKHLKFLGICFICFSNFNLYLPGRQVLEVAPSVRTSNRSSTPTLPLWMESTLWKFQWWFYKMLRL